MLEKAKPFGYRNIGFILDRGYFPKDNLHFMDEDNYPFLIMTKGMDKPARSHIELVRGSFETERSCHIPGYNVYGIRLNGKLHEGDAGGRNIFIYFRTDECSFERWCIEKRTEMIAAQLYRLKGKSASGLHAEVGRLFNVARDKNGCVVGFEEMTQEVKELLDLCGYYVIACSEDMSAEEALMICKGRDCGGKLFRMDKSFLGGGAVRSHSDDSLDGKLFVEFVALILRSRYYRSIKVKFHESASTPDWAAVPASIDKLDQIGMTRQPDGIYRQDAAITKTKREILGAFGISGKDMRDTIREVSESLKGDF
jgi:hypothetical protein